MQKDTHHKSSTLATQDQFQTLTILLITILLTLLAFSCATKASAEAVLNPNQITGTLSLTNQNPAILEILHAGEGFNQGYLRADSRSDDPSLNGLNTMSFPAAQSPTSIPYQLTVEADANGLSYQMRAEARLESNNSRYFFDSVTTSPVFPEPAADVVQNFNQCAAVFDVRFVTPAGTPTTVEGGDIIAYRERTPGSRSWAYQANDYALANGADHDYLVVHGDGSLYHLIVAFEAGTDIYKDRVKQEFRTELPASCDQIIPVNVVVSPPDQLGEIIGQVDMQGENEINQNRFTRITANNGPMRNYRLNSLDTDPSSGPYRLENMMYSDASSPPRDYYTYAEMAFGVGHNTQYFRSPILDGYRNAGVRVEKGLTTDLGNTFVFAPGYVSGKVEIAGPQGGTLLGALFRDADQDYNQNGIPDSLYIMASGVTATGSATKAAGAEYSAYGGLARASFSGDFDADNALFSGAYQMALGGLRGQDSNWLPNGLNLRLLDGNTSDNGVAYQNSLVALTDNLIGEQLITPETSLEIDRNYCASEVRIDFRTLSGTMYAPQIRGTGSFSGEDFSGAPADFNVQINYANGLPFAQSSAASNGHVNLVLPQGDYNLTPYVQAVSPNGQTSRTELRAIPLSVGCEQRIKANSNIQVNLDPVVPETGDGTIVISGVIGGDSEVAEINYTHNDKAPVKICTDCGLNPSFSEEIVLEQGENLITVEALGNSVNASVSSNVTYLPPMVISEMSDINLETAPGGSSAIATFAPEVSGGDSGPYEILCDPASGSPFAVGTTQVSCSAIDGSGGSATTQFNVNVTATPWPELVISEMPDINLETAPGGGSAIATFAPEVSGGDGGPYEILCDPASGSPFAAGTTQVSCSAIDGSGGSATTRFNVNVTAIPWPELVIAAMPDINLKAAAGMDSAMANFTPEVSGGNGGPYIISCTPVSGSSFAVGTTQVDCRANDPAGHSAATSFTIRVSAAESVEEPTSCRQSPPVLQVNTQRQMLWPPNHKLVDIGLGTSLIDGCGQPLNDSEAMIVIRIYSNEPEVHQPGNGDGNHAPDARLDNNRLRLRSERMGNGDGRVYLLVSEATDANGQTVSAASTVSVPHSGNRKGREQVAGQASAAVQSWQQSGLIPAGFLEIGVSPAAQPVKMTSVSAAAKPKQKKNRK